MTELEAAYNQGKGQPLLIRLTCGAQLPAAGKIPAALPYHGHETSCPVFGTSLQSVKMHMVPQFVLEGLP